MLNKTYIKGPSIIVSAVLLMAAAPIVVKLSSLQSAANFLGYQRGHIMSTNSSGKWRIDSTLHSDSIVLLDKLRDTSIAIRADLPTPGLIDTISQTLTQTINKAIYFDDACGVASSTSSTTAGDQTSVNATAANGGLASVNQNADNQLASTINLPCVVSLSTGTTGNSTGYATYSTTARPLYLARDWTAVFNVLINATHPNKLFERYWMLFGFTGNVGNFPTITPASTSLFAFEWRGDSASVLTTKLRLHMDSAAVDNIQYTSFAPTQNVWYQLKMNWTQSTKTLRLYQNGTLFKTIAYGSTPMVFGGATTRFLPFVAVGKEESHGIAKIAKVDFIFFTSQIDRNIL